MSHRRTTFAAASALALLLAAPALAQTASVAPVGATVPTAQGGANASALLYNAPDPTQSVIAATGELGGLEFYGLDGRNVSPPENQNFKLVPWSAIAAKLGLPQPRRSPTRAPA